MRLIPTPLRAAAGMALLACCTTVLAQSEAARRPQLSAEQARHYAYSEVLRHVGPAGSERSDPWDPLADPLARGAAFTPDYVVDPAARADNIKVFHTVQAAVSRAVADSKGQPPPARRLYLLVKPGTYRELVYIPAVTAPLTIYGEGKYAAATRITAKLDASVTGAAYTSQYAAQFARAAPEVQAMFDSVKEREQIRTFGTATVWVQSDGFQARNLTFENGYNKDIGNARAEALPNVNNVHHQALALQVEGADKAQFENVRLIGFQDTLYVKAKQVATSTRSFFNKSYIEGDVDFIFGDSTAYFYQSEIKSLGDRGISYVAAPNTNVKTKYGFVFDTCRFTHDGSANARAGTFHLLRQWFHNSKCTPYAARDVDGYRCTLGVTDIYQAPTGTVTRTTLETVGKMVVLNSRIGAHINRQRPWADWNKPGAVAYRPVQYSSDDYWNNLKRAGIDPVQDLGYARQPSPADIFLGEFNNEDE
ncbi:MAG: pectinesterase family protein [Duganella sp.]